LVFLFYCIQNLISFTSNWLVFGDPEKPLETNFLYFCKKLADQILMIFESMGDTRPQMAQDQCTSTGEAFEESTIIDGCDKIVGRLERKGKTVFIRGSMVI
jgi:hypothetical protein